jgi:hypothetical protein
MSKHRLERPSRLRPRLGRIAAASGSLAVTTVALLGGAGIIPLGSAGSAATNDHRPRPSAAPVPNDQPAPQKAAAPARASTALPAGTGSGKRVVFSMSRQRVWLIGASGTPTSTYLVSGSLTNNLKPGRYDVYSRSRWAVGIDDSGVMEYFVRFTRGERAPIGFHSIPTKNGKALQKESQLGTPQSHGCIRARLADAKRLYDFAPAGTDVVVVA